jgi:hypothetical protein
MRNPAWRRFQEPHGRLCRSRYQLILVGEEKGYGDLALPNPRNSMATAHTKKRGPAASDQVLEIVFS